MKTTILHRFSIPQTDKTEKDQRIKSFETYEKSLYVLSKNVNFNIIIYMYLTYFGTMRTRVFVAAVRNRKHYPKDTEPSRMFIAMRIEMLSDGEWYWAEATDIYGHDGIGGMIALGGWNVVAWMPMPDAYEPPNNMIGD